MSNTPSPHTLYTCSECWIARGIGLLVNSFFLLILFLAFTNEDGVAPLYWPTAACVIVGVLGIFVAMRWERIGGRIAMAGAGGLVLTNLAGALFSGLGWYGIVTALIYAVPFFLAGSLFVSGARRTGR